MRRDPYAFPPQRLREILLASTIVFANESETDYITSEFSLKHITDLFALGKTEIFVQTLGKRGSLVHRKLPDRSCESLTIRVTETPVGNVDAVGAGDAYVAGFLFGLRQCAPLPVCAQYGSTLSSFVIEKEGSTTNLPTLDELIERNNNRPDAGKE